MKVLVIEDHPPDRKLLRVVLQSSGHVVHERTRAEGAVRTILRVAPDVVLLDLRLPGMDGLALVRQLRASEGTQHIPIVVVTAYPESYPRHTMLEAGCDAYIGKPIDTRSLPNQIAEAVARRSA